MNNQFLNKPWWDERSNSSNPTLNGLNDGINSLESFVEDVPTNTTHGNLGYVGRVAVYLSLLYLAIACGNPAPSPANTPTPNVRSVTPPSTPQGREETLEEIAKEQTQEPTQAPTNTPIPTPTYTPVPTPTNTPIPTPRPTLDEFVLYKLSHKHIGLDEKVWNALEKNRALTLQWGDMSLEELTKYDSKLVIAALSLPEFVGSNGLTLKAKKVLDDTQVVFSYEPMKNALRFDDKWSSADVRALLDIYSNWNPFKEISRNAINAKLDEHNVADPQLREIIPHIANVTYVENAKDANGNPITPSRISFYTKSELQGLVSYDRPIGPYSYLGGFSSAGSHHGWIWQMKKDGGSMVSPFLEGEKIFSSPQYKSVSDNPVRAAVEKVGDYLGQTSQHFYQDTNYLYQKHGYPPKSIFDMPIEVWLLEEFQGKHPSHSHLNPAAAKAFLNARFNIPALLIARIGIDDGYHGALVVYLPNGKELYMPGDMPNNTCIPSHKFWLTKAQFDEFSKDGGQNVGRFLVQYTHGINPECPFLKTLNLLEYGIKK